MTDNKKIRLAGDQMEKIGTAILSNCSLSNERLPGCIIWKVRTDGSGNIWFLVKDRFRQRCYLENEFPAELQFYNKNLDFYIRVKGSATILGPATDLYGACSEEKADPGMAEVLVQMQALDIKVFSQSLPVRQPLFGESFIRKSSELALNFRTAYEQLRHFTFFPSSKARFFKDV